MGTDIHTAVEVRLDGYWKSVGEAFESTHDWKYLPATREVLESLDDEHLLDALDFYVLDSEYRSFNLSENTRAIFEKYSEYKKMQREQVNDKYKEQQAKPKWDYAPVKALEFNLRQQAAADWCEAFAPEQREEVIAEAIRELNTPDEDGYVDDGAINLNRRPSDKAFSTHEPFDCRNYDLFAALAGVRNGRGFAGVYTGEPLKPIAEPRGVPDDADPRTVKYLSDEHTPSWLTLTEILDYDWDQGKIAGGVVNADLYELLKQRGNWYPWDDEVEKLCDERNIERSVSGFISGQNIKVFTPAGYEEWKKQGRPRLPEPMGLFRDTVYDLNDIPFNSAPGGSVKPYVQIRWTASLRNSISDEFWTGVEQMKKLVPAGGSTDDVRLVFDFDS